MMKIVPYTIDGVRHAMLETDGDIRRQSAFNVAYYRKLSLCQDETELQTAWHGIFAPANDFLATLSDEECAYLGDYYQQMSEHMRHALDSQKDVTAWDGTSTTSIDAKWFADKLLHHMLTRAGIATPPQYDYCDASCDCGFVRGIASIGVHCKLCNTICRYDETTSNAYFNLREYMTLVAISLQCKLLAPLWSSLHAYAIRKGRYVANADIRRICLQLIEPFLQQDGIRETYEKLKQYAGTVVMRSLENLTPAVLDQLSQADFKYVEQCDAALTYLLIKNYVNVNLLLPESNLVVWSTKCLKMAFLGSVRKVVLIDGIQDHQSERTKRRYL